MSSDEELCWYAVRCVFATGWPLDRAMPVYEERITLWRASSAEEAIERAEAEALVYACSVEESPDTYLGIAQSYRLVEGPGDGAEVFSLMRNSTLEPDKYLDTFFDTGAERQKTVE
ncbi:hypothetical protein E1263_23870 [Kribbella antibiotica]|uniref:DUF4288 domain-containing protein n=1 Tax=Kribbella antibiotica TaxID=190195 RepID=A0A4R4ZKV3_9ACTN|nr:hypothetical protein [Kribbella antibiotica]TDD57412.1 hypothetical protein E1263_23870 [Kribbella antibiotica]